MAAVPSAGPENLPGLIARRMMGLFTPHAAMTNARGVGHAVTGRARRAGAAMRKKRKPPPGPTGRGLPTECDPAKDHNAVNTASATCEQSKHRETLPVSFWLGREPFTVANLQK